MEKWKEDTWESWKLRSRNCSVISEEFSLLTKIIDITIAKSSFAVFNNMIIDIC